MSEKPKVIPPEFEQLRRNSRIAAGITLVCGVLILAAIAGSFWQVWRLQETKGELEGDIRTLEARKQALEDDIERAGGFAAQGNLEATQEALQVAPPVQAATDAGEPPLPPPPPDASRTSVPRIYFQIRDRSQIAAYEACRDPLTAVQARVPQYELLERGPSRNELRYFHDDERAKAEELRAILERCLGQPVALSRPPHTNVNPLHFEVWLAPPS